MKKCTRCKKQKPVEEFSRNRSKHDGLATECKTCVKEICKDYYKKNKKKSQEWHNKRRAQKQKLMIEYLNAHPCVDCGEGDIRVLEFDHLDKKNYNVSSIMCSGSPWSSVLKEVELCEVVCANCHRIRTFDRGQQKSYRFTQG